MALAELAQPRSECGFDRLGICRRELVFERKRPVRPGGKSLRVFELLELRDQLVSKVFGASGGRLGGLAFRRELAFRTPAQACRV